MFRDLEGFSL